MSNPALGQRCLANLDLVGRRHPVGNPQAFHLPLGVAGRAGLSIERDSDDGAGEHRFAVRIVDSRHDRSCAAERDGRLGG